MSSLNVRFPQTTRGKTDLLNCTKLPSSDSVHCNHQVGAGLIRRVTAEQIRHASVRTGCVYRDKTKRNQEGLQKDCAEGDRWGEASDYEKVTSI